MSLKTKLKQIKASTRYCMWKASQKINSRQAGKLYDVNKTYLIDPARIKLSLDSVALDRIHNGRSAQSVSPVLEHGKIIGGDWDINAADFEQMDVWLAFSHHFADGGNWADTAFYKRVTDTIKSGKSLWGCNTVELFEKRLKCIELLYADIRDNGYNSQCEIECDCPTAFKNEDEVHVHIGRNGDYIFADGRHRLCIAKLLGLKQIPVKVARRHQQWVEFRRQILYYGSMHGDKVYAPLTHPDLADIPSVHGHERFEMIRPHLDADGGRAIDIGTHWGYFCHMLDSAGYKCTAVERDAETLEMLKKLMRSESRNFEIVDSSILNYDPAQPYDVVIALNIFHHFIKTPRGHEQLEALLGRLQARKIFFQPHDPAEAQMQGVYKNYQPREFAEFVAKATGLTKIELLGAASDNREIFYISS